MHKKHIPFLPAHQKPGYETIYHMVQHEQNWYEMKSTTTLKHTENEGIDENVK